FSKLIVTRNRNLLRHIEKDPHNRYTLSIKYQLVENIRTNKLILQWGSCSVISALPSCFLLLKRNRCPENSNESSLWGGLLDLTMTLTVLVSIIFLMYCHPTWRSSLCSKFRLHSYFYGNGAAVSTIRDQGQASDLYFEQFGKAWKYNKKEEKQYRHKPSRYKKVAEVRWASYTVTTFTTKPSAGFSTYSYFTLQVIELLSNIYSTTVISLSFSHIFKSKIFHNNFISILLCFYGHYYLFTFTRIVLSIFQNGLITLGDSSSHSHTMLMVFSILRFYELFFGVYCSIALVFKAFEELSIKTIERVCATLLISDYEVVNPRRYISVILIIFAIFMGHLLAYFTTHGIVNNLITSCFIMIGFTIVTVSLFTMISLLIQWRNSNYEKKLEKSNDFYALSLKFQLRENFRAFRLLRRVSLISGIAAICMCIDTYFIIVYEYDKNVSSLLGTLFDTMPAW
uniref:Uncharacterized protein n=1 Tax=Pristionchus pacificus TaxID=54126 RepID=A0A8R1Z1N6_PRIPA